MWLSAMMAFSMSLSCPFADAVYRDMGGRGFSLTASPIAGGVLLEVQSDATGHRYRFRTTTGNGYSTTTLQALVDGEPVRTAHPVTIYAMSETLDANGDFPRADDSAPAHIFAPELGRMLWHEAEGLGGPSLVSGVREQLGRIPFKLASCDGA